MLTPLGGLSFVPGSIFNDAAFHRYKVKVSNNGKTWLINDDIKISPSNSSTTNSNIDSFNTNRVAYYVWYL